MKGFFFKNINGILGTIVFHLLIIAWFMAARLSTVNQDEIAAIMIDFNIAELPDMEIPEPETRTAYEQYLDNVLRSNIAVNEAEERPVPDQFKNLDASEFSELDQRVAEILQQASAGQMPVLPEFPEISMEINKPEEKKEQKKAEPYTGPTNIYYNLQGRRALWLPVPIYKCPDKGIVTVDVLVNQLGNVVQARVNNNPKNFNEECLFEAAITAALKARFNQNASAPSRQAGTITFHFQPQDR
jgi:hypothetical protein